MSWIRLSFAAIAGAAALASPALARADEVTKDGVIKWNEVASNTIVTTAGQPPAVSALSFAIVQGAVYDAVNAIDGGYQPYRSRPSANPWDSKDAAAAAAAFNVLEWLFPGQAGTLQSTYDTYIAALPDEPAGSKAAGVAVGEAAAATMIVARTHDGRGGGPGTLVGTLPGVWRPTIPFFAQDPAPWVGEVLPFLLPNAEMVRSDGPNALTSAAYAEDFDEVKQMGSIGSTTRTKDQTEAAIWWQGNGAFWNGVTRDISAARGLGIVENARLFAMEDLAAADGFIGCYKDKYYWKFWRPVTAIREGDNDGNAATAGDPNWTPLFDPAASELGLNFGLPLSTPPFPDHPSAHSCASSAIVHSMQDFFGTDKVPFSAFSIRTRTTRSFDRLSDALKEVIDARVWGGIHFRTADEQGAVLGKKVAHWERKNYFQPLG
jgi:PAP2 superfamily